MDSEFKAYELSFLVKNPEEEKTVLDLIAQHQGKVLQKGQLKETRLSYPIRKNSSAYFGCVQFELLPANLEKLSQSLKLNPAVLRYLTVTPPFGKQTAAPKLAKEVKEPVKVGAVSPSVLTNEALEEKLEEILK